MLRTFLDELVDAVYPALCPVCRGAAVPGGFTCAAHELPDPGAELPGPRCERCSIDLPEFLPDGTRCAACRRRAPRFRCVVALGPYQECAGLRAWILALKHGSRADLARPLGRSLGLRLARDLPPEPSAALERAWVVPVPLHPLRRIERGCDQALLLARALGEVVDRPVVELLRRRRWTLPQGAPGARSRRANVSDAFALVHRRTRGLQGRSIVLVDDVLTSGATADACSSLLIRAGSGPVAVACLARAGSPPGTPVDAAAPRAPS